jgi:HAD superfamily hydrolase (TIGR01484 family)
MRYHSLACDYDGTIAHHGAVAESTIAALQDVKKSGRKLVLVTGRELDDLFRVFPHLDLFDRVVAENGALLYRPGTREEKLLAEAPPNEFARELIRRGAERVSIGRVIVATWEPFETTAVQVIRDMGLELQVIFNKGAVMILPSGVNKASGLNAALLELGLSAHNVVGVGDAENDHAFLGLCECSAAVANALPMVKQKVDWVTSQPYGHGVEELIQHLIASDLAELEDRFRRRVRLGTRDGKEVVVPPYGKNILIAGSSGAGKSTLATAFMEHLAEQSYQFLIVDPEGDYSAFEFGVALGDNERAAGATEILDVLAKPGENPIVNMVSVGLKERPAFFESLLPRIQELRAHTGRPHWIIVDETHHVMPASRENTGIAISRQMYGLMLVTLEPDRVAPAILSSVDLVIAIGENPDQTLHIFSEAVGDRPPPPTGLTLHPGEAVAWFRRTSEPPFLFRSALPRSERRRHRRKYAEGELRPELSFYFRGPGGKLNLKAQNLNVFLQLADGVDDETWSFHLNNGDISGWFLNVIKDEELAAQAYRLEDAGHSPGESRKRIRAEIEKRYILAAKE